MARLKRLRRRAGLSLIEVMISMAVLAFVLLAFMSIMHSATSLSTSSKESSVAVRDLQSAVEDTFAQPWGTFKTTYMGASVATPPTTPAHPFHRYWQYAGNDRPLRNERMELFIQAQDTLNPTDPQWYEYRVECTFTNHRGYVQKEFIVTKRSK